MKIRVDEVTGEARELSFAVPQSGINSLLGRGPIREYRVSEPIAVEVSCYRAGTDVFFEGRLTAVTVATCARCTEEFSSRPQREFRFVVSPRAVGYEKESSLSEEDLEFSLYEGDEIDLAPLINEQLLLALPSRPLCREDCRGLCLRCGVNLNHGNCDCPDSSPDPRLAVVRSLLGRHS